MRKAFLISLFVTLFLPTTVFAQTPVPNCERIFGGGTSCEQKGNLTLDKKVKNPASNQFVDNLSLNDPKLNPQQPVIFQITLTNTGQGDLSDISVTDILPQYVSFTKGPGKYDQATGSLEFTVDKLAAGQSRSFLIETKSASQATYPKGTSLTCAVNQATAKKGSNSATDNAQFCIQHAAAGQTTTPTPTPTNSPMPVYQPAPGSTSPKTGPELLGLIGLIPGAAAGLYLRKKSSGK